MSSYKYSQERRHNPEIRAVVVDALQKQSKALADAQKLLAEAQRILSGVPYPLLDQGIYYRVQASVNTALMEVKRKQSMSGDETDTYVGNIAASQTGEEIEKDLKK